MSTLKIIGTFSIIIGCFAIIYPRFMHPLVLHMLGMHSTPSKNDDGQFPPQMRHARPVPGDRKPPPMPHDPKDLRHHMRPGPHPGMRAAAEMQKQQSHGTGRGMMGIVLPMYAVGICVYLVYTLFKVFNKRGKYPDPYSKRPFNSEGEGATDRMGFPQGFRGDKEVVVQQGYGEGEVQQYLQRKRQERELEDLLVKMDDSKNVSEDEMRVLQRRLEETESQMTRILQAMQSMQSRVTTMAHDPPIAEEMLNKEAGGGGTEEKVETVGATSAAADKSGESQKMAQESQDNQSRGSSPDTESYEFVKKSASATTDASPESEMSSPSSFEQISQEGQEAGKEADKDQAQCEDILLDEQEKEQEQDSTVRHRKTGHLHEDTQE